MMAMLGRNDGLSVALGHGNAERGKGASQLEIEHTNVLDLYPSTFDAWYIEK
jgi:hypothetical protein